MVDTRSRPFVSARQIGLENYGTHLQHRALIMSAQLTAYGQVLTHLSLKNFFASAPGNK